MPRLQLLPFLSYYEKIKRGGNPTTTTTQISVKTLFKLVADKFILSTREQSETLSAKSLAFAVKCSKRSFI